MYTTYPQMIADLMTGIYRHDSTAREHLLPLVMQSLKKNNVSLVNLGLDGWKGVRSL
jgi:electron transfer flavoprotein-quinone oxidoreductase